MNSHPPRVLAVGMNARNLQLLGEFLNARGCRSMTAQGLSALDEILETESDIALALVDITDFAEGIWQRCRAMHEAGIRLLVISPRICTQTQARSALHGARGMLVKPLAMRELTALIQAMLMEQAPQSP